MKSPILVSFSFCFCIILDQIWGLRTPVPFHVGVVLDMDSWLGKVTNSCMSMALSDFYSNHTNYRTRLVLHTRDSQMDVIGAASAAMDLIQNVQVEAIIGPQKSAEAEFIIDLGEKAQIPIISFSATSPSLSSKTPYFVRTTPDDHFQVKAIASIIQAFGWRKVIPIHEDTDYGNRLLPYLIHDFQEINTRVPYRSVIPHSVTDDQILEELHKLKTMQTSVFVVHVSDTLGARLFLKAREAGMMSEGYVWIITDGLVNVLESKDSSVIDSMQGVLSVHPHIPRSKDLDNFIRRWKRKFLEENQDIENADMISFGIWAYDTIWALAMAAERVGDMKPHLQKPENDGSLSDLPIIGVSQTGPKLIEEILKIEFKGLSGDFHLVNGQLQSSAFRILNVIGRGGREVGIWTPTYGISRDLSSNSKKTYSTSDTDFRSIIWPGESTIVPKGWVIPTDGKKLRIGVPVKDGFSEFVKVEQNPCTNTTTVTGYCIDVFKSVVALLPYTIPYEFVPFQKDNGKSAGTYNDLIYQVYLQNYDAVVGDTTITANRSLYVDFALPYTDGGVWMIVPTKHKESKNNAWVFLKPLTRDIWLLSGAFFIFTGFVIWVLEQRVSLDFSGSTTQHIRMIFNFSLSTVIPAYREKQTGILYRFLVIIWLSVVLIFTSSYAANLTSMLTIQNFRPAITDFKDLIKNGDFVGYRKGSFVLELLKRLNFDESKLKDYNSPEECHEALSKGSQNGGVAAVFDEKPYINVFLAKYCSTYTIVGPIHKTDGFGFVFPRGSPLLADISKAVLNVTEGDKLVEIEQAWFGRQTTCDDDQRTIFTSNNFWSLFLITGTIAILSLIIVSTNFSHKGKCSPITVDSTKSNSLDHFDQRDLSYPTSKKIEADEGQTTCEKTAKALSHLNASQSTSSTSNYDLSYPTSKKIEADEGQTTCEKKAKALSHLNASQSSSNPSNYMDGSILPSEVEGMQLIKPDG